MIPLRNLRIRLAAGQIFWREVGSGQAIVFLHGSWQDGSQWVSVMERLSQDYHCFAPDLLGFGESERPKVHYSIESEVECLADFFEALKLQQVYLVGHSLGSWIATSYALRYPEQVQGLVLVSPEGVQVEKRRWTWERWLLGQPPILYGVLRLAKLLGGKKAKNALQYRKQLLQSPIACRLLFKRRHREIMAESLQDRLEWLKIPVLILQGEIDQAIALSQSQSYAKLAPTAQLQLIKDGENNLPESSPDIVSQQIQYFINNS